MSPQKQTMEQYRKSPRAKFLDYDGGDYFITICTGNKKQYFGKISDGEMHLSEIGLFVESQLKSASEYCKDIEIPLFVVMPNHIHAIVSVSCNDIPLKYIDGNLQQRSPNPTLRANPTCRRHVPTLSRYISSLKGSVTKFAKSHNLEFGWQPRYHDHYIRGNNDGNRISDYILNNVARWQEDCFFKDEI